MVFTGAVCGSPEQPQRGPLVPHHVGLQQVAWRHANAQCRVLPHPLDKNALLRSWPTLSVPIPEIWRNGIAHVELRI